MKHTDQVKELETSLHNVKEQNKHLQKRLKEVTADADLRMAKLMYELDSEKIFNQVGILILGISIGALVTNYFYFGNIFGLH